MKSLPSILCFCIIAILFIATKRTSLVDGLPSKRYFEQENVIRYETENDQFNLESETGSNRMKRQEYDADDEADADGKSLSQV